MKYKITLQSPFVFVLLMTGCLLVPHLLGAQSVTLATHQLPKNYALPSPEAAGITKVADIPVNLSTGQANISIPLFTINTGKMTLPFSLNYDASGIKVEQEASATGLGWTLSGGGSITRTIRDKDDFTASSRYEDIGGPGWTGAVPAALSMTEYDLANKAATNNIADAVPDMFMYNYPAGSGRFVNLGPVNGVKLLPRKNIKITGGQNDWTLVDESGDQYFFGGKDINNNNVLETNNLRTVQQGTSTVQLFTTAWPMTKIVHHDKKDIVEFEYQDTYIETITGRTATQIYEKGVFDYFTSNHMIDAATAQTVQRNNGKILSRITFNGGTVEFTVSFLNRYDLLNVNNKQPRIEGIKVKDITGQVIKELKFNYDYLIAAGFTPSTAGPNERRLSLTSVQVMEGSVVREQYSFNYNTTPLPPKSSFALDHWGYYNGRNNTTLIPAYSSLNPENELSKYPDFLMCSASNTFFNGADRNVNPASAKAGILEKITYPTGGSVSFNHESNTVFVNQEEYDLEQKKIDCSIRTGPPLTYSGGGHLTTVAGAKLCTVEFDIPNNKHTVNGIYYKVQYRVGFKAGDTKLQVTHSATSAALYKTVGGADQYINSYELDYDLDPEKCFDNDVLYPGHYKLVARTRSDGYMAFATIEMVTPVLKEQTSGVNVLAGGLRIREITYDDGQHNTRSKSYSYTRPDNPGISSGYSYKNVTPATYSKTGYIYDKTFARSPGCYITGRDPSAPQWIPCCYTQLELLILSSSTNYNPGDGAIVYYQFVRMQDGSGQNGNELYQFGRPADKFRPWENNLLLKKSTFDAGNVLVQDEENEYTLMPGNQYYYGYDIAAQGNHPCVEPPNMSTPNAPAGGAFGTGGLHYRFDPVSMNIEWKPLTRKTIKEYTDQPTPLTRTETYTYDPASQEIAKVEQLRSDGRTSVSYFKYPSSYTLSGAVAPDPELNAIGVLKSQHIHNQVVEKYTAIREKDNTELVTGGSYLGLTPEPSSTQTVLTPEGPVSAYTAVRADNLYQTETTVPMAGFQPSQATISGTTGIVSKDSRYKLQYSILQYDNRLNPTEVKGTHDAPTSLLWMHQQSLLCAQVSNAALAEIAFSSFEDKDNSGQWTYTVSSSAAELLTDASAPTGLKVYQLGGTNPGSITHSGLDNGKQYIVSLWYKGAVPVVANTISSKAGMTTGGYTYREYVIGGTAQAAISSPGSSQIDELRLYPAGALMKTWCHKPLTGILSACDEKNSIQRYEYDAGGRLIIIRDQDRNIVKKIDYSILQIEN